MISLTGRAPFTKPAAAVLILTGALLAVLAVKSGDDAHGPVERVPGARPAVVEHEELGERARNVFLFVALIEIAALVLALKGRERIAHVASGLFGIVALYFLFEAAEHGGELVYSYAGGVGIRSGEEEDVERLLLAGIYHQAELDRKNGRYEEAAALLELAETRNPDDPEIDLLVAESWIVDRKQPERALEALSKITLTKEDARLRARKAILEADAREALGQIDEARSVLETIFAEFPENTRLKRRLEELNR